MADRFEQHAHEAAMHDHQHIHIAHHARGGNPDSVEHLTASHSHSHNHSPVEHAHSAHENVQREHEHEAHIHDHSHPTEDR